MELKTKLDAENYTWTSAAQAIFAMLQYTDKKDLSLSEVMGYSTHAFRINIHPEVVSPAGPTMFDPYDLVSIGLKTIGVKNLTLSEPAPLPDDKLAGALRFAQTRIDTGVPVISWDIFAPEFGVIYGYDNEKQLFNAKDMEKDSTLKYSELNERRFNHIFLCGFMDSVPKSIPIMLKEALTRIIEFSNGKSPFAASTEYIHGLEGYKAWIQAFGGGKIDEAGNAYNAAIVADARRHAHLFFSELLSKWEVTTELDRQVFDCLQEGKRIYGQISDILENLPIMFPFPHGGEPNDPSNRKKVIDLLQNAYERENEGFALLQKLLELVQQYEDATFMSPYKINKMFQFAGEKYSGSYEKFNEEIPKNMQSFMKRDKAIEPRIFNIRLIAFEPRQSEEQESGSYIVARPVTHKPDQLPSSMKYYITRHEYAYIRGKTMMIDQAYEKLEIWIEENGFEKDNLSFTIEQFLPLTHPEADEEVEIYIPLM